MQVNNKKRIFMHNFYILSNTTICHTHIIKKLVDYCLFLFPLLSVAGKGNA